MIRVENRKIFITGGSSGIGLEAAKQLYSKGSHLALFARDEDRLHLAVREIERYKVQSMQNLRTYPLDVSDPRSVEKGFSLAEEEFGTPDVVVLGAGISTADYFENISYDAFDRVMKTNLYGVRNCVATLLPSMKQKGGKIVIVSSLAGLTGMIGYTAYGTSKFALVGFAECLRPELKRHGIDVVLFCPPEVETPFVHEEAKTLPREARFIKNIAGTLSAEDAGRALVKSITGKRFLVVPGIKGKSSYFMTCYLPGSMVRNSTDLLITLTRRR